MTRRDWQPQSLAFRALAQNIQLDGASHSRWVGYVDAQECMTEGANVNIRKIRGWSKGKWDVANKGNCRGGLRYWIGSF